MLQYGESFLPVMAAIEFNRPPPPLRPPSPLLLRMAPTTDTVNVFLTVRCRQIQSTLH